jgi:hypothetical protein
VATQKVNRSIPALLHAITYTVPFCFLSEASVTALLLICLSHFAVDRWRLARYVVYAKNHLAPHGDWDTWQDCQGTGYHKDRPPFLAVWLLIIADNIIHVVLNAVSIQYL